MGGCLPVGLLLKRLRQTSLGRTLTGPGRWAVQPLTQATCCDLQGGHWPGSQAGGRGRVPVDLAGLHNPSQKGRHTQL